MYERSTVLTSHQSTQSVHSVKTGYEFDIFRIFKNALSRHTLEARNCMRTQPEAGSARALQMLTEQSLRRLCCSNGVHIPTLGPRAALDIECQNTKLKVDVGCVM